MDIGLRVALLQMICLGSKVRYSAQWRKRWPDLGDQQGFIVRKLGDDCFEVCWEDGVLSLTHKNWLEGVE